MGNLENRFDQNCVTNTMHSNSNNLIVLLSGNLIEFNVTFKEGHKTYSLFANIFEGYFFKRNSSAAYQ